jgi:hypothetical protein
MSVLPSSILSCVDSEIDSAFFSKEQLLKGLRYEQKSSCIALCKPTQNQFDGYGLIAAIYERIEKNLMRRPKRKPSNENWKLRSTSDLDTVKAYDKNPSDEVTLERAIVQRWPNNWTYQMPVASGLFGPISDKRRAVDLVHSKGNGQYDFVELKIRSDTPLYAAMEILGYGLVYLASRLDVANNLKYVIEKLPVLKANEITLCVLAPEDYYKDIDLKWLQDAINSGLHNLDKGNLKMDFRFQKFLFPWNHKMSTRNLPERLDREFVY